MQITHPDQAREIQWVVLIGTIIVGTLTGIAMWHQIKLHKLQIAQHLSNHPPASGE